MRPRSLQQRNWMGRVKVRLGKRQIVYRIENRLGVAKGVREEGREGMEVWD